MPTIGVLALVVSLLPAPAAAQNPSADPDMRELVSYTLTMDTVNKLNHALLDIVTEMRKDPKVQELEQVERETEALKKKDERTEADDKRMEELQARHEALDAQIPNPLSLNDTNTLNEQAAKIQKYPFAVAALRRNGLTPREYATAFAALLQAGLAAGLQKAGIKQIPEGTNPANVKFVLEHEAELQKMQQAWGEKKEF